MRIETKYGLGDSVFVIGQQPGGCQNQGCVDPDCGAWSILVQPDGEGGFAPLRVGAVLAAGDPAAPEIFYAFPELQGEAGAAFFPEDHVFGDVDEAGRETESRNSAQHTGLRQ